MLCLFHGEKGLSRVLFFPGKHVSQNLISLLSEDFLHHVHYCSSLLRRYIIVPKIGTLFLETIFYLLWRNLADMPMLELNPKLAETVLLFDWVTDVPFLPKMDQLTKLGIGNRLRRKFCTRCGYVNEI